MAKKKKEQMPSKIMSTYETAKVMSEYNKILESDPAYSLDVDPKHKYKMTDEEKDFVRFYLEYRNIPLVAMTLGITQEQALEIFKSYNIQQEIKRINRSLTMRQFQTKMLSIPQLMAYLSSYITDENVPEAKQLSSVDKVDLAKYLIGLNVQMSQAIADPTKVMTNTLEVKVKDMSVETIKQMLAASDNIDRKKEIISQLNTDDTLTLEDMSFLETLSVDELLNLLTKIQGEDNGKSKNS